MGVKQPQLNSFDGWPLGINNVAKESSLPRDQLGNLVAFRDATNVDLDRLGNPSRRDGYVRAVVGTLVHSAWSHPYLPFGLFVDGETMKVVFQDESADVISSGIARGLPVSYALINDTVVWCNEAQSGSISPDLQPHAWAPPTPGSQPELSASADGALDAGVYQVAVTFLDTNGRESGASLAATIDLPALSFLTLAAIPQPADTATYSRVRIYMTNGNDGLFRAAVTLPVGTLTYSLGERATGRPLETQFLQPLPPGHIVRLHAGRQFVANNNEVMFSPALRYGQFNPAKDRVRFTDRVTMMEGVGDGTGGSGLFVADTKRTYFLAGGDPKDWRQVVAHPYGVIPGTASVVPGNIFNPEADAAPVPVWLSQSGHFCVGSIGGKVIALKVGEAAIDNADSGALLYREGDGENKLVATLKGAQASAMAVTDKLIVTEYRHTS